MENDNVENEASQNLLQIGGVNPIYHPPQICRGIRDNNEVICSNPTPNNLSDQTPGDGFDVEGNDSMPQSPRQVDDQFVDDQNSTSQQFYWAEENVFRSYSSGDGRHDGSDFALGQHFESKEDLNLKLSLVAINGKFEMKTHKSTKTLKEVRCVDDNCLWRLRARKLPNSNFFVIRQYNGFYSCTFMNRSIHHRQASSHVIGARMQGHFTDIKETPKAKVLMRYVREELKVQCSYWKAWKARKFAQHLIRGTPKHSFGMLPSYCHVLKEVNPDTVTHIELDSDNKFKYFFMALGAAIRGFRFMRKVIGVDGAWIKTQHKGVLLVAATQDSEYHSYPIA